MKIHSSPLPYIGGKTWLARWLLPRFKQLPTLLVSPFFGGGTLELNLALRGTEIVAGDINPDLVNFWQAYLENPKSILDGAKDILKTHTRTALQTQLDNVSTAAAIPKHTAASYFYLKAKLTYRGKGVLRVRSRICDFYESGGAWFAKGIDSRRETPIFNTVFQFWQNITDLPIHITVKDFAKTISEFPESLIYCDPPYVSAEDYNNIPMAHKRLSECLKPHPFFILSYKDHPLVHELYEGFRCIQIPRQEILSLKKGYELLILSEGAAELLTLDNSR